MPQFVTLQRDTGPTGGVPRTGCHLILDGETDRPLTMTKVERFLRHYPRFIGMRRITEPVVIGQKGGCCGYVIIAESHISVHSRGHAAMVDVFSCIGLNTALAIQGIERLLGLKNHKAQTIPRPMSPAASYR